MSFHKNSFLMVFVGVAKYEYEIEIQKLRIVV